MGGHRDQQRLEGVLAGGGAVGEGAVDARGGDDVDVLDVVGGVHPPHRGGQGPAVDAGHQGGEAVHGYAATCWPPAMRVSAWSTSAVGAAFHGILARTMPMAQLLDSAA